jgi:hypothetical protein
MARRAISDDEDPPGCFLPSPSQIEAATAAIRAGWSPVEFESRKSSMRHWFRPPDPSVRQEAELALSAELVRRQRQVG